MEREIVFEPINFEDPGQKSRTQFTTKVFVMENGKKSYPDEESGFMYHEYSNFASAKYNTPEKRDWLKVPIEPDQACCSVVEKQVEVYDDALAEARGVIFGKYDKLYTHARSIKHPKEEDELEVESADPDKPKKPKQKYLKLKLDTVWSYYLDGERLDIKNGQIVRKGVTEALTKSKDKGILDTLSFTLSFTDEAGKQSKRLVKMGEIESRKDINTKVFFRRPENVPSDAKKVNECSEDELTQLYGEGELQDVRSPEDMDKYYRHGSYIRFIYTPQKIWAAKAKDDNGKRKFSFQWICKQMDIINIRQQMNSQSISRVQYGQYAFGKRNVSQMLIKEDSGTTSTSKDSKDSKQSATQSATKSSTIKTSQVTIEKDDEDEEEEEEEEEEVEVEDQEEEEEEEIVQSKTINTKTKSSVSAKVVPVVETKSKTPVRKTK